MSAIEREIHTQPANWRQAAALAPEHAPILPGPGERVAAVGCGTSLHMARAYAAAREASGAGETDVFPASEMPGRRRYDRLLAISRSGTTSEVVRLLDAHDGAPSVVVTAVAGSPCAERASATVVLDFADEQSVVQTRFATTALALLLAGLGRDVESDAAAAEQALEAALPDVGAHERFVFLGAGWTIGLADEAALKVREAAGAWAESYPAMEYRHGPISASAEETLVWPLGGVDPSVLEDAARAGSSIANNNGSPLASLVLAQRTAVAMALARNLDPDHPHSLTRSVVLP
ncbi:MAG TPA: SIS domain-containing protein [Gaiellales bacterium]|jgi:fructoselysine-6-P-deglycase FrlB-like protein|nr:SIS domain-containing protein [Gaiellales bacterium]